MENQKFKVNPLGSKSKSSSKEEKTVTTPTNAIAEDKSAIEDRIVPIEIEDAVTVENDDTGSKCVNRHGVNANALADLGEEENKEIQHTCGLCRCATNARPLIWRIWSESVEYDHGCWC